MNWWQPADPVAPGPRAGLRLVADRDGRCPDIDLAAWDICLTTRPNAPRPWIVVPDVEAARARLLARISETPIAAQTLIMLLRSGDGRGRTHRLRSESLAYASLQAGSEFVRWRSRCPAPPRLASPTDPVRYEREGDAVSLVFTDPVSRNAYSTAMRDRLIFHLDTCLLDPTRPAVLLRGEGPSFCTGGALEEFGLARDSLAAHRLRMRTSAVTRLWRLGDRARACIHGPVIGSGIEIAAAVPSLRARENSWFQLPELAMGLLPGAGGTVTIVDRIGRHRAAWMMLSGARLRLPQALAWGLVDAIDPA